jgi:cysteinyl-tRNA synthetase
MKYLGEDFDIHTGGEDNIFPHHENEIAQSVAATGKGFARFWLHSAHLMVDGEKMSKSLGNFYTLSDLLKQGHSPRTLRYVLLTTHYRLQLNFTESALRSAGSSLERLDTLYQVAVTASGPGEVRGNLIDIIGSARKGFTQSLEDDLGIAGAMAALFDFVSAVHRRDRTVRLNAAEGEAVLSFWRDADQVFGVLLPTPAELSEAVETLVHERMVMRRERKFEEADQIRRGLADEGYQIEDGKEGTLVIWKEGRVIISF